MMENNDLPGVDPEVFCLMFEKDYFTNVKKFDINSYPKYIYGIDLAQSEPKNFWHKVRKFFGLKYKYKSSGSMGIACKVFEDGKIEIVL